MTTNAQISRMIKSRTGLPFVKVHVSGGAANFYSDDEHVAEIISTMNIGTVYIPRLNLWTSDEWSENFLGSINLDVERMIKAYIEDMAS